MFRVYHSLGCRGYHGREREVVIRFFMPMNPPRTTAQQHRIRARKGKKAIVYDSSDLAEARAKLTAHLAPHKPESPMKGALRLTTKWMWQPRNFALDGTYKSTRPDTDNLQKLLKDVMTKLGFWKDDAQVVSEIIEKFWAITPGIFIRIEQLQGED